MTDLPEMDALDGAEITPEDLQEELDRREEKRAEQVAALTISIINKRKDAVEWRQALGIEEEWLAAEDAYEGIDNANRAEEEKSTAKAMKPRNANGGSSSITSDKTKTTRSTAFLNITRPYTDAAAARVADMLLPSDDRNFSIGPTPISELSEAEEKLFTQEVMQALGVESPEDLIKMQTHMVTESAEKAQTRIDDWLTECQYHAEVRQSIEDCSKLGTGIIKGPVPVRRKFASVVIDDEGNPQLKIEEKIAPGSNHVDPWDLFPDKACGDNIQNGSYLFERDRFSGKQVRDLIGQPGYLDDQLKLCIEEGPSKINLVGSTSRITNEDDRFEVWYFHGQITEDDLSALTNMGAGESAKAINNVVCTLINDRIVKVSKSHLDSDGFPYDMMPWQRRAGMPFGIGIAKQISVPQRMLNSSTRSMNDNSAISSGVQIVSMRGVVDPADGVWELTPNKQWWADPDSTFDDIHKAFMAIEIPSRQAELMAIINFALKMAEDVTGMPMLMQGNQGKAPDTVGGMEILNNNSNTVLRRIARLFDDNITEPHMRRYYEWIMIYGEDDEKGDFSIDARGSTSLVDRDIQRQAILSMGATSLDPRFGLDPELWAEEALRANKIDPVRLKLTDEKKEQQQKQQQQMQEMQMQMWKMEQDLIKLKIESDAAVKREDIQKDIDIAAADNQLEAEKFAVDMGRQAVQA